jgi:hypothetical protein
MVNGECECVRQCQVSSRRFVPAVPATATRSCVADCASRMFRDRAECPVGRVTVLDPKLSVRRTHSLVLQTTIHIRTLL